MQDCEKNPPLLHKQSAATYSNPYLQSLLRISAIATSIWCLVSMSMMAFGVSNHLNAVELVVIWGSLAVAVFWGVLFTLLIVVLTRWALRRKRLRKQEGKRIRRGPKGQFR